MNKIKFPAKGLDDKMAFGKHRGKTIRQVIDSEPSYLDWCEENVDGFTLTLEARAARDRALLIDRPKKGFVGDRFAAVDDFMKRRS